MSEELDILPDERTRLDLHVDLCARRNRAVLQSLGEIKSLQQRFNYILMVFALLVAGAVGGGAITARDIIQAASAAAQVGAVIQGAPAVPAPIQPSRP